MNQSGLPASLGYKRDSFRKQIRKEKLNQNFASKRKLLFMETCDLMKPQNEQITKFTSWNQVNDELSKFLPEYAAIHLYVDTNSKQGIPEQIERKLLEMVHRPEFLSDEAGLALLITLTNIKKEGTSIFGANTIKLIVDNLIKSSLVEIEVNGEKQEYINFFETVCYTLYALADICESDHEQIFEALSKKLYLFEQSSKDLCLQQLFLFQRLSMIPSFLPSVEFIIQTLHRCLQYQSQKSHILKEVVVILVDNFMRQNQANPLRFQMKDQKELLTLALEFTFDNLENQSFSKQRKVDLIDLLTSLINSSDENTIQVMFSTQKSYKLFGLIYYNCEYATWQVKRASLECIVAMMGNQTLLPYLVKRINPSNIAYLCYNSILLPDAIIQKRMICAIMGLCWFDSNTFIKEFKRLNISKVIKNLQPQQQKNDQEEDGLTLSQHLLFLDDFMKGLETNQPKNGGIQAEPTGYGYQNQENQDIEI